MAAREAIRTKKRILMLDERSEVESRIEIELIPKLDFLAVCVWIKIKARRNTAGYLCVYLQLWTLE